MIMKEISLEELMKELEEEMDEPTLYIPIGLPACGKTTHRERGTMVICKDDIRFMMLNYKQTGKHYDKVIEDIVDESEKLIFEHCLMRKWSIYLDECNLLAVNRRWYWKLALSHGYRIVFIWYKNYSESYDMNERRLRKVPLEVMDEMLYKIEPPTKEELSIGDLRVIGGY